MIQHWVEQRIYRPTIGIKKIRGGGDCDFVVMALDEVQKGQASVPVRVKMRVLTTPSFRSRLGRGSLRPQMLAKVRVPRKGVGPPTS